MNYCKELGSAIKQLGNFKDFIHKTVEDWKTAAPEIFAVKNPDKVNTADSIFISKGTRTDLYNLMREMNQLDKHGQHRRIRTEGSKIILLNADNKPVVVFYQVSLKKEQSSLWMKLLVLPQVFLLQ